MTAYNDEIPLLLIDDDLIDVMSFRRGARRLGLKNPLHCAGNGEEALDMLKRGDVPYPCIILLDLNMPRMNGIEFLRELRQLSRFSSLPVWILSTSDAEEDIRQSYALNVAGYMVKQKQGNEFDTVIGFLKSYLALGTFPVQ